MRMSSVVEWSDISGVGKPTICTKLTTPAAIYTLHAPWSLKNHTSVALAMYVHVMTWTNFPCLQSL